MSESKPFTLAVVKGASRGQVLRTDKRRISIGAAKDNDLAIDDSEVTARHFMVLIDHGRWRTHTFSQGQSITVDRRWSHPTNNDRGAVITAGSTQILLYPGWLDQEIIDREILDRADSVPLLVVREEDKNLVTLIGDRPVEFTTDSGIGTDEDSKAQEPTDAIDLSTMPTVTGDRLPEEIRLAARARLLEHRGATVPGPFAPGSDNSLMTLAPDFHANVVSTPLDPLVGIEASKTDPINTATAAAVSKVNAWGDAPSRKQRTPTIVPVDEPVSRSHEPPRRITDPPASSRALVLSTARGEEPPRTEPRGSRGRVNAWGDRRDGRDSRDSRDGGRDSRDSRDGPSSREGGRAIETPNSRETVPPRPSIPTPAIGRILRIEDIAHIDEPALAIVRDPDGEMATSIRLLGARIEEFMRTFGYRAYMVSSPEPLTGKTTTAANLALALAEDTHRRIALIEANFRYPRFAELFGIPEDYGLIPLLEGQVLLPEAIAKLADRNLVILPAGGRHPNPAALLSSPRFKALIAELANTVDIAIVDAPAVTPFADANILLPLVDAALLVVSEEKTHANWIARAQKQLGEARILGAVYNRIPKAKMKELRPELKERMRQS